MWEMIGTSTTVAGTTGYPPKETIFNPYFILIWSVIKYLKYMDFYPNFKNERAGMAS